MLEVAEAATKPLPALRQKHSLGGCTINSAQSMCISLVTQPVRLMPFGSVDWAS